jgi:ubiquinone/menaquinone biosynthesis C-methylase UbiE
MSSSATHDHDALSRPDFGKRAESYDRLRPADANWAELLAMLVREGELEGVRVLDVGCGTGRVAAALAERNRVWAVDPSPEMLAVARRRLPRGAGVKQGRAEDLPFKDGSFDAAVMWLVVHLVDRPQAFMELRRVLEHGGRLLVATFDPAYFDVFWLNRLFPSLEAIDRARFPTPNELDGELRAAGFAETEFVRLTQRDSMDREHALARIRGKHISTFDLIGEDEYEAGLARAERELPDRIDYTAEWCVAVAR